MTLYALLVGLCWVVFIIVWAVTAFSTKRTLRRPWWREIWLRVALIAGVLLVVRSRFISGATLQHLSGIVANPALNAAGLVLCAAGIALAIWARIYLGHNWGTPMSVKENPELVTAGPYAYIRNPIYSGIMLAMVGTAFINAWWVVPFLFSCGYFIYSSYAEEKIMQKEFPDTYPAYKARTKMLIPLIF